MKVSKKQASPAQPKQGESRKSTPVPVAKPKPNAKSKSNATIPSTTDKAKAKSAPNMITKENKSKGNKAQDTAAAHLDKSLGGSLPRRKTPSRAASDPPLTQLTVSMAKDEQQWLPVIGRIATMDGKSQCLMRAGAWSPETGSVIYQVEES